MRRLGLPDPESAARAESLIAKVSDAYVKPSLAADAKDIAVLYTDDAVEMPPSQPMVQGRAAIEQYYPKQMGGSVKQPSFALTKTKKDASGDIGYEVGTYCRRSPMTASNE